jgi:hypothetical protein
MRADTFDFNFSFTGIRSPVREGENGRLWRKKKRPGAKDPLFAMSFRRAEALRSLPKAKERFFPRAAFSDFEDESF